MPKQIESATDANKNPSRKPPITPPTAPSISNDKNSNKSIPTTDPDNMIPFDDAKKDESAPKTPIPRPPPSSANLFQESASSRDLIFDNKVKMDFYKPPLPDPNANEPTLINREETYSPYSKNDDNQAKAYQNMIRNQKAKEFSLMRNIDTAEEHQPNETQDNYFEPLRAAPNEPIAHADYIMQDTESEWVYKCRNQDNE